MARTATMTAESTIEMRTTTITAVTATLLEELVMMVSRLNKNWRRLVIQDWMLMVHYWWMVYHDW
jgi:hypothetical protein